MSAEREIGRTKNESAGGKKGTPSVGRTKNESAGGKKGTPPVGRTKNESAGGKKSDPAVGRTKNEALKGLVGQLLLRHDVNWSSCKIGLLSRPRFKYTTRLPKR